MKIDSEVEQQVLRSLRLDSAISSREICLQSHRGVVTLSGTVPSHGESSAIYYATLRAPGVCGVVNGLTLAGKDAELLSLHGVIPDQSSPPTHQLHVIQPTITADNPPECLSVWPLSIGPPWFNDGS